MQLRKLCATLLLTLLIVLGAAPLANADTSDFTVDNFVADYTLGEDDPQGTLAIREQLTVDFSDYNHGILRALPERYNSMPQHIHVLAVSRDGSKEQYSTYKSNSNLVLKIGNPNSTITGLHHYEIDYRVTNVIRIVGSHAELNWNVNGTGWQQQFLHVSAQLHVPANLQNKLSSARCFTGQVNSTQSDCLVTTNKDGFTYTSTHTLSGGETLTFNNIVPAGYFKAPTLADRWDDYKSALIPAVAVPLVALLVMGRVWLRRGRDAKGRGTIVPEYGPPDNLKPAEVDVIMRNKLGKNAISATIIDLAIRGYLKIQEGETNGVLGLGKHKTYSFVRQATPAEGELQGYEAQVLAGIFDTSAATSVKALLGSFKGLTKGSNSALLKLFTGSQTAVSSSQQANVGQVVEMNSLRNTFYTTAQSVRQSIPKSLASSGYFVSNPATAGNVWLGLGFAAIFGSFFLIQLSIGLFIGVLLAGLIIIVFAWLMPSRTSKGAVAKDAAEGLKLYLNTAEKDRIAMLQSPNAPYAAQSTEPTKTVELFEKLLPYAMVLGVEKQWAKQFESIYTTPPDWYSGNWSTFNALYFTDSLSNSVSAMNSSFAAPSSSSSGSSGSAGGGGGGGGGGGW